MIKILYLNKKKNKIRIDKFLYNYFKKKNISRQKIQKYIKNYKILLNNKKIKKKKILHNNDIIKFKKSIFKNNNIIHDIVYKNSKMDVKIHYEDNNIIVINKKPGQVVHPGNGYYKNTIINWLKFYIEYKKINSDFNNIYYRFGLLHRLDKNTSGLLIIAKNIKIFNNIKLQFLNKTIKKKYLALVWGIPKKNKSTIKNYIGRNKKNRIKMIVMNNKKYGRYSITKYKILKKFIFLSLIECEIKTGRTHQIRVHLKYIGHPVFNDDLYGGNKINSQYNKYKKIILNLFKILPRQALHAYYLNFKDPITKKNKSLISKLPKDINNVINYLNNKI